MLSGNCQACPYLGVVDAGLATTWDSETKIVVFYSHIDVPCMTQTSCFDAHRMTYTLHTSCDAFLIFWWASWFGHHVLMYIKWFWLYWIGSLAVVKSCTKAALAGFINIAILFRPGLSQICAVSIRGHTVAIGLHCNSMLVKDLLQLKKRELQSLKKWLEHFLAYLWNCPLFLWINVETWIWGHTTRCKDGLKHYLAIWTVSHVLIWWTLIWHRCFEMVVMVTWARFWPNVNSWWKKPKRCISIYECAYYLLSDAATFWYQIIYASLSME